MSKTETVFQGVERRLDGKLGYDQSGQPEKPEYALFRSKFFGVTAALDRFSPGLHGVVVYSHDGQPGMPGLLAGMRMSQRLRLDVVRNTVERVMHAQLGESPEAAYNAGDYTRIVGRYDGFAVPEDPHYVLWQKTRERAVHEEPVPEIDLRDAYELLKFDGETEAQTRRSLGYIMLGAELLDGTLPSNEGLPAIEDLVQQSVLIDRPGVAGVPLMPRTSL